MEDRSKTREYPESFDPIAIDVEVDPPTLRLPPVEVDLARRDSSPGVEDEGVWVDPVDVVEEGGAA